MFRYCFEKMYIGSIGNVISTALRFASVFIPANDRFAIGLSDFHTDIQLEHPDLANALPILSLVICKAMTFAVCQGFCSLCISLSFQLMFFQHAVLVGQLLGGLAQPFFTNSPAKLAGEWFPTSERNLATTIASMCNPLGIALGQVSLCVPRHSGPFF